MRIARIMAWLLLPCMALGGCQRTGEGENQAYVLMLGLDRGQDGLLRLTARVPKVGRNSSGDGGQASGGGKYLSFTASGADWPQACEALERATPRPLNLSHIDMIVASRTLASEAGFPALVRRVAQTPHLYTTARFIVCEGSAGDLVNAQEAVIGQRLSAELQAMLAHYADEGTIPDSSLAEYDYAVYSIYSDPLAILARLDDQGSPVYAGAALFREGVCVMTLDADQTRLMRLIRGEAKGLDIDLDGRTVELTAEGRVKRRVTTRAEGTLLGLEVRLSTANEITGSEIDQITNRLRYLIDDIIERCQRAGVEPFGFSERAAAGYTTVSQWLSCDWRSRYAAAQIRADVRVKGQAAC